MTVLRLLCSVCGGHGRLEVWVDLSGGGVGLVMTVRIVVVRSLCVVGKGRWLSSTLRSSRLRLRMLA